MITKGIFAILKIFFGGWRSWLMTAFATALAVTFSKKITHYVALMVAWGLQKVLDLTNIELTSTTLQVSGFAAYLLDQFRLADCLALLIQFYILKWMLKKVPFLKW